MKGTFWQLQIFELFLWFESLVAKPWQSLVGALVIQHIFFPLPPIPTFSQSHQKKEAHLHQIWYQSEAWKEQIWTKVFFNKGSISSAGLVSKLGLLVYGRQGREICRRILDRNVCKEVLSYSLQHRVPVVAFSEDRCLTVFDHPLVNSLHEIYHEPKAEVIPSVEQILASFEIQKLLMVDTAVGISSTLRPYWSEATKGQATVVQAVPDMLEIVPLATSKGNGVKLLLDHLGVSEKEVMAIGDGENDVEMLKLASLGIALANGSDEAKAVADVIGMTNDEDGVAEAIYKYVL